jgi:hypothetical protein
MPPTSIFQNGAAAQAAQNAVDQGIVVIAAAGNNGTIAYQSAYHSDGTTFEFGGKTFEALDFDASANTDFFQDITATKDQTAVLPLLTWSEPNGQVTSNFEMFLLNSPSLPTNLGDNILTISGVPSQTAIDYPLKELIYPTAKDQKAYLVIGRELNGVAAPAQIKWISNANGLDRTTKYEYINSTAAETGSSSIFGVANLPEVITVGAEALSPQQILEILQDTATPLSFQQATGNSLLGLAQADAAVARSQIIAENLSVFTCSEW